MLPLFVHGELMGRNQKQKNPNKVFVSTGWCVEFFFNEAVNWQKPFFYSNNSDIDCFFFLTSRCQSTDGELIGAVECSCADCWSVKVLNQKVSLLLITHNATNSHVRLSPFFPQPAINILAVVQKEKKKTIYTQLSQWDEQTACRCLFGS